MGIPKELAEWFDSLPTPTKRPPGAKGYGRPALTEEEVDQLRRLVGVKEVFNKQTRKYEPWP